MGETLMTPQKARMLTMEDLSLHERWCEYAEKKFNGARLDEFFREMSYHELKSLLATAHAAMKVVEAANNQVGEKSFALKMALKPFQQTGEDKGGRGDE